MEWSQQQLLILDRASRRAQPAYLRLRALAVWQASQGRHYADIALCLRTSRQSVSRWVRIFRQQGLAGLRVRPGRGRPVRHNHDDVPDYLYQSPRQWGLPQTRWSLKLLQQQVPSLKGFSLEGVRQVLQRYGLGYKRGQPHLHSPDPHYAEKKRGRKRRSP